MTYWHRMFHALGVDRRAVTSLEYGLIAGVLSAGLVAAMTAVRSKLIVALNALNF